MSWLWEGIFHMDFNIQVDRYLINKRKIFEMIKFLQDINDFQITSRKIEKFDDLSESFELVKNVVKEVSLHESKKNL